MDTSDEEEDEESLETVSTLAGDVDSFLGTDNLGDDTETRGDSEGFVEDVEETLELRVVG